MSEWVDDVRQWPKLEFQGTLLTICCIFTWFSAVKSCVRVCDTTLQCCPTYSISCVCDNIIMKAILGFSTPTQYVVNTLYWPHTALSVYLVCYFLVPHTHVLCMGSGSATGKKNQVRLVHSLLKYFFKFQLWYWIQIYTTKYSNLLLIILILVWIVCSTYRKGEILMQKWHVTSQFVYCYMPY